MSGELVAGARCALLALLLQVLLTACAGAPTVADSPADEFLAQGLHPVDSSGFEAAYVLPGAGLPAYRTVHITPLDLDQLDISPAPVGGTLRRDWQMTPERSQALQDAWATAMARSFSDYQRSAEGKNGLRIGAALTRVAPGRPTATTIGGGLQPAGSSQDVVEISAEFRLYDQHSGQLLAVIRDRRTMTSVALSRTAAVSMQRLFGSWAALLHTRVAGR